MQSAMQNFCAPALPDDEAERQATVDELRLAVDVRDASYDRIVRLLTQLIDTPIAAFTIVDRNRQFFRVSKGLRINETPREVSFCGHAILQEEILEVQDALKDSRFAGNPLVTGEQNIRFYAGIPVRAASGSKVGTLCVIDNEARKLSQEERTALTDLRDLMETELALRQASIQDHLTGLFNRRHFDANLEREWRRAQRSDDGLGVLLIDIDRFKGLNDQSGHLGGDQCLKKVAAVLDDHCRRAGDMVARFGGDEFCVMLSPCEPGELEILAETLRQQVAALNLPHPGNENKRVTISIGGALANNEADFASGSEALMAAADAELYTAKKSGRNRVSIRRGNSRQNP